MDYRASVAASDTTYHSFHDIETLEQQHYLVSAATSSCKPSHASSSSAASYDSLDDQPTQRPSTATKMQRQDSGYESHSATPRTSTSHSRPLPVRRTSNSSSNGRIRLSQSRTRPPTRRSAHSYQPGTSSQAMVQVRSNPPPLSGTFFQFPAPSLASVAPEPLATTSASASASASATASATDPRARATPPPATTHYWTSDNTRRLEYAAIDACSRGFKGWMRRHLVPECFSPRHLAFDDDSGSVRRYRLELEDDEKLIDHERNSRKAWQFWTLRKSNSF